MTFEKKINYTFADPRLLEQALTHKSFFNENAEGSPGHNERFEFLGDAVLDLSVSDLLMKTYPEASEGELSKRRASLVNENTLAQLAKEFNFQSEMRLGKGELQTGGTEKPRLLACVFEAFIGALFLDTGFEKTDVFVKEVFSNHLEEWQSSSYEEFDFKTRLQEYSQEKYRKAPEYKPVSEEGPDHEKTFHVLVIVNGQELAHGQGKSKKQAEQEAARLALEKL